MSFTMEQLKKRAREAADVAVKMAGDVVDCSKEKLEDARLNVAIKDAQTRLGAAVYESYRTGKDTTALCEQIEEELDELMQKKEERRHAEPYSARDLVCPRCGAALSRDSAYCSRCGFFMKSAGSQKQD